MLGYRTRSLTIALKLIVPSYLSIGETRVIDIYKTTYQTTSGDIDWKQPLLTPERRGLQQLFYLFTFC